MKINIEDYPKVVDNGKYYCVCSNYEQINGKTTFLGYENNRQDTGLWELEIKDGEEKLISGKRFKIMKSVPIDSDYNIKYLPGVKEVDWRK